MVGSKALASNHPGGEDEQAGLQRSVGAVDAFDGKVGSLWDGEEAVTTFGQMPYFVELLKTSDCSTPGWTTARSATAVRTRPPNAKRQASGTKQPLRLSLGLCEAVEGGVLYEYVVLVTSLDEELHGVA